MEKRPSMLRVKGGREAARGLRVRCAGDLKSSTELAPEFSTEFILHGILPQRTPRPGEPELRGALLAARGPAPPHHGTRCALWRLSLNCPFPAHPKRVYDTAFPSRRVHALPLHNTLDIVRLERERESLVLYCYVHTLAHHHLAFIQRSIPLWTPVFRRRVQARRDRLQLGVVVVEVGPARERYVRF